MADVTLKAVVDYKFAGVLLLAATFVGAGSSAVRHGAARSEPVALKTGARRQADQEPEAVEKERRHADWYGDPLPPGAIARLGSMQFRHPPVDPWSPKLAISDPTTGVSFSPDGQVIATSCYSGLRLWDANTGNLLLEIGTRTSSWNQVFSPDGRFLAAAHIELEREHRDATGVYVCLLDAKTGKLCQRIQPEKKAGPIRDVLFSPDSKRLAMAHDNGAIHLWDTETGKQVTVLSPKLLKSFPRRGNAEFADLTADGQRFVGLKYLTEKRDRSTVEVRDLAGDRPLFTLNEEGPDSWAVASILTLDGRLLIRHGIRSGKLTIRIHELATGKERLSIVAEGRSNDRERIALSPDGRILAAGMHDRALRFWDLLTGQELPRYPAKTDAVQVMVFSPNGRFLATGHDDGEIVVWDVPLPKSQPAPLKRSANEVASWWNDLAGEDAAKAHGAIGNLVEAAEQTIGLVKDRLRPAEDKSRRVAELIAQLDDDKFEVREAASKELESTRLAAELALRRALSQQISREQRRRIDEILDQSPLQVRDRELLRGIRAVEVLEHITAARADAARAAAIDSLRKLARGASAARMTQEAKAALLRLETR